MPIFMDRHDVSDTVTAEHVAALHQADLKIQHEFNCKGLTYWFDGKRKTAFCLIEAPDKESLIRMHDKAHGELPHRIIEVDDAVVESFLGRIEDPKKSQNSKLNIINDPAFRTIMVIGINGLSLKKILNKEWDTIIWNCSNMLVEKINVFNGSIVKQKADNFLISFDSVTNAVSCAMNIHNSNGFDVDINIGISSGIPITEKENIFEDTIKIAERLCNVVKEKIVITSEVKDLYESENLNISPDKKTVHTLSIAEERFLNILMNYVEREWRNADLNVDRFIKNLGYSKSALYRIMLPLTGKSPNTFIKEYRLNKALKLLIDQQLSVSEISFESGFNSPAYFTKEFKKQFGFLPTNFTRGLKTN